MIIELIDIMKTIEKKSLEETLQTSINSYKS